MRAVFLTAGAAGMYCGSCMHDNSLARAMRRAEVDCVLQPVYTPIRTDDENIGGEQVFFGGIHIYLLQQFPWLRRIPGPLRRTLDWAPLIRAATKRSHSTDAAKLGALAVSMLQGVGGHQADEVNRLANWLVDDMNPDVVLFSNLLIGGVIATLRQRRPGIRLVVQLQGDDIFLDHLPEPYRGQAIDLCRDLVPQVDQFVIHSQFYARKMSQELQIPEHKIITTPLSIDTAPFASALSRERGDDPTFRLGYLARIAPEKGLHNLVDAFVRLAADDPQLTLQVAGWLGESNRAYLAEQDRKIRAAGLRDRYRYHGSPSLEAKVQFLQSLDLFSVPTDYRDPKGLFVLEALAAGVPVVQPDHGAFGELLSATGGGLVCVPGELDSLCEVIAKLRSDHQLRAGLAESGRQRVFENHSIEQAAQRMKEILFPT